MFDSDQEAVLKSLPLESINGPWTSGSSAEEFWEQVAARRQTATRFASDTAGMPWEMQVKTVTDQLMRVSKHSAIELDPIIHGSDAIEYLEIIQGAG